MSTQLPPPRDLSPDDALPPVEPPSAGFILQLFFIPGMIVLVIVMIWLLFSWLAHKGNDRDALVKALSRNNEARWQAAFNLANDLRAERGGRNPRLTTDGQFARDLAAILDREIASASTDEHSITLRIYLCRALGEFRVPDGLPVLVKAADTQRSDAEGDVRRAALEGIAFLANNLGASDPHIADNAQLREVLLKAAADSDPRTRSAAAVAMGVVGSPELLEKLRYMLDDSNPDVRYNAATRLAHHGDVAAVPMLAEMLDPSETAGVNQEKEEALRPLKRNLIAVNALRAAAQLAEQNRDADLTPLKQAVEKLLAGDVGGEVRIEATNTLRILKARASR
jgi:HEAT repeat protein